MRIRFLMILVSIFEHIPILKQLPHFSSCRVFGTYLGFETITRFQINVNFQAFTHVRNFHNLNLFCLENAKMIKIQDMFENGKPDIVLKKVKGLI